MEKRVINPVGIPVKTTYVFKVMEHVNLAPAAHMAIIVKINVHMGATMTRVRIMEVVIVRLVGWARSA